MKLSFLTILACLALLLGSPVFAADTDIAVSMQAFKVISTAKGLELVPTQAALPGDTIEYQVTYRNLGTTPARQVTATLPVPADGMAYLPFSATPATVLASLDGKQFAPAPLQRVVVRNGHEITETVPASEYRFLRWTLGELPAGQSAMVKARMRLVATGATEQ